MTRLIANIATRHPTEQPTPPAPASPPPAPVLSDEATSAAPMETHAAHVLRARVSASLPRWHTTQARTRVLPPPATDPLRKLAEVAEDLEDPTGWALARRVMVQSDQDLIVQGIEPVHVIAGLGSAAMLHALLENAGPAVVHQTTHKGLTPLHYAALFGRLDNIAMLLEWGADRAAAPEGSVRHLPIDLALRAGHLDAVRLLGQRAR